MSVFIAGKVLTRDYRNSDLSSIINIYKTAFAEPPWNEEWSNESIAGMLNSALSKPASMAIIAQKDSRLVGMTWGFNLSLDKFPFLADNYIEDTSYVAELAVGPNNRREGVGGILGEAYVKRAREMGIPKIILRTDERNPAALRLYRGLGFSEINVRDPEYENRIYLSKSLGKNYEI